MSKFINISTKPFTKPQLRLFRRELEKAGGADALMLQKEALKQEDGLSIMVTHKDIEGYKEKHLNGVYEPLREHFNTEVPYVFWNRFYEMLRKVNPKIK